MNLRSLAALLLCVGALLAACSPRNGVEPAEAAGPTEPAGPTEGVADTGYLSSIYSPLVDGLHVTGTPVKVEIETYRLQVVGNLHTPLALSLEDVRALDSTRLEAVLECPGVFVDSGFWTGVPVKALLEKAGVKAGAGRVSFTSVDGAYTRSLSLDKALDPRMLVAYEFDDREFPVVHGFPLRLVAPGEPGSTWVKWLGRITVE